MIDDDIYNCEVEGYDYKDFLYIIPLIGCIGLCILIAPFVIIGRILDYGHKKSL